MTPLNGSRRAAAALVTAVALGAAGTTFGAAPAFAHTPTWSVTCDEVKLDLTRYTPTPGNEVTVTVDGKDLLPTETFGAEFHRTLRLPAHDKELTVRLIIKDGSPGGHFSRDETKTAPVCQTTTPTPTPTPSGTPSPSPTPTTAPPSPSPSTPAPSQPPAEPSTTAPAVPAPTPPKGPGLADTGASGSTPLVAGAAAAVLAAGAAVLWAVRRRRTAQG
ncbi:LAETG motif-containing sortase-dependent surface protein [Streptomyces coeruleoprunus]|uniref:LAETG motif-containing sortase-dependent surface protein n=1 Tax=Streptomyces coeruleoprunus TaxID=285563 RepID=A0ABV9XGC6_9ACTN